MGIFSYSPQKEGKGVRKDAPQLRRFPLFFVLFGRNFFNIVKVSMLFFLTSIPIITIPASVCGLTYVSKCFTKEEHAFILSDYIDYFKTYFFKSVIIMLVNLIAGFSLYTVITNLFIGPVKNFLLPLILINLLVLIMDFYMFPMLITYDIPLWGVLKNGFIFAMIKLPLNIIIALVFLSIIACAFGFYPIIGIILTPFILTGFLNFLSTFYVLPTIEKNMEED